VSALEPVPDPQIAFEIEQTPLGPQTLVPGVAPITARDRLAMRANAPLEPSRPQRACDHGLFDTNARNQLELFGQLPPPPLASEGGGG